MARNLGLSVKSNVVAYMISWISYKCDKKFDLLSIWESKELSTGLQAVAFDVMPKINKIISAASPTQPEPKMYARKEECWESIKKIDATYTIPKTVNPTDFYTQNDALIFISDDKNFYNQLTWMKIIMWNEKNHILNKNQKMWVNYARNAMGKTFTKTQVEYLKDIFVLAVKRGYKYK